MGKQTNLYSFPDVAALAPALRTYVIQCQNAGIVRHGIFKVAVSGGSLPATLAKALLLPPGVAPAPPAVAPAPAPATAAVAHAAHAVHTVHAAHAAPAASAAIEPATNGAGDDLVRFDKWEIFFADERAVPLDHPDSNYALLKSELLDKIPAGAGQPIVHTIDTSVLNDTQELADQYEQVLVASFASRDSVRLPIFDLLLLGCGPDGHTCSLFPGHELLRETSAWVAPIEDSPKPPPRRVTLTLPVVTHSVRVAFVATGASKKEIMKQIFDQDSGLPCALVNDGAGDRCSWFVDSPAIEGVSFPKRGFNL